MVITSDGQSVNISKAMTTSQAFSQGIHLIEKSDFSLLRLYIEQEISNASLQQLVETIQNSKDAEVSASQISLFLTLFEIDRFVSIHSSFRFDWTSVINSQVDHRWLMTKERAIGFRFFFGIYRSSTATRCHFRSTSSRRWAISRGWFSLCGG